VSKKNTKREILKAAKTVFSEKGYEASTMDEIAEQAGIRKALIFYYFPTKEILFLEAWNEAIDELENTLFRELANESIYIKKIKKLFRSYIDFVMSRREVMRLIEMDKVRIMNQPEEYENWTSMRTRYNRFLSRIEELIEEGKQKKALPSDISTKATAKLLAQMMGMGALEENITLERIIHIVLAGMDLNPEANI
jgi:TetR/AcrR family transcriptional regulator